MKTQFQKKQAKTTHSVAQEVSQTKGISGMLFQFVDNRQHHQDRIKSDSPNTTENVVIQRMVGSGLSIGTAVRITDPAVGAIRGTIYREDKAKGGYHVNTGTGGGRATVFAKYSDIALE